MLIITCNQHLVQVNIQLAASLHMNPTLTNTQTCQDSPSFLQMTVLVFRASISY